MRAIDAARAAERHAGRRFCTNCQSERALEGGRFYVSRGGARGRTVRWMCAACSARRRSALAGGRG
jgi:RNase P subunit RPR2